MQLNQLELSYSPEHDRLILRIGTTTGEIIQLFYTRRFIHVFWPVLQQAIDALKSEYIAESASSDAKNKPSGTGVISHNDKSFELNEGLLTGDEAVLITSFGLNYKDEGITEFSFTGIDGVVVTLNFNQGLIDSLSSLIEQIMPKIEWDMNLDDLEVQPATEDDRVIH
ncbi:MAG TPA: hypothetical protein EYQ52_08785 [Candidatus Thioglobus sp.]|nr:hypothetical protein [Candidatus Thioglobus sp.]